MNSSNPSIPKTQFSDFKSFQAYHTPFVESTLHDIIPLSTHDQRDSLLNALSHSLLNGGKRIRPLLVIASSYLFSNTFQPILPLAAAIEAIHTYSLIHDDLPSMDNDDLRRGKPTCHVKFGEDIAILAGDTLNTLAFEILSTQLSNFSSDSILTLIRHLSCSMGIKGLVGGQVLDIVSSTKETPINDQLQLLKSIHLKKTGALIEQCILGPAILYNAPPDIQHKLQTFSKHIGLLFQIIDDLLDVVGSKDVLGKSPLKDQLLDKLTYASIMSLDDTRRLATIEKDNALTILNELKKEYSLPVSDLHDIVHFIYDRSH